MSDKEITDILLALWLGFSISHFLHWKIRTFDLLRIEKTLGWKANLLSFAVQSIGVVFGLLGILCMASLMGEYARTPNNYISPLWFLGAVVYVMQVYLFKCFKITSGKT